MSLRRTGQEGLMLWLQARTSGYKGVNVVDFTKSWENGLAFCALIHSFYPDLIPFDTLEPQNKAANLKLAFDTADKLGVPALMDPEDMLMDCGPDKFSVITYISQYFHKFKNFDKENGSDEVIVKAPPVNVEDEIMKRRQKIEQERMLLKKCAKCSQGFPNGGTIIDALGKQYHPDCFICFACSTQFKDNKFVNVDSNPYCQQCAKDKFTSKNINSSTDQYDNPPCYKCKKLCEGDTINALGHSWHPDCFACTTCNKVFTSGASKVLNVDGYPYCEQCGRRAFVSRRTVTSPSPSQGMSKSKSMSAIPKMAETPGETASPTSKPLLGGSKISISSRLNAFQAKPEDAAKKPEPVKLKESALAQRKQEEEQRKKKEEEEKEAKRIKDEEDKEVAQKKKEDEKLKKKQEEEEKKRKEQEDKEAKKKTDEENKKKRAEDIKKKKEEEEARKKKEQEEEEERKREKQEQIKRQRADSMAKKMEAEEIKKKEEEEKKKKEKEEDEARKEALRKKREDMKLKEKEEEKKKEEATSKRTSIRFLHRSITETFVAHNKLADVQPTTTTKIAISSPNNSRPTSPVSTPRESAPSPSITISPSNSFSSPSTPRDSSSSSSSSSVTLNPPHSSPSSLSHSASSSSIVATLVATPRTGAVSPSPSLSSPSTNSVPTSAAEKSVKLQSQKITCPAADVMCGWTGSSETVANHSSTCPFVLLRPILHKLQSSNEELARKVDILQGQQDKDRVVIASLQAKLTH